MNRGDQALLLLEDFISIAAVPAPALRALLDYALEQKRRFRAGQLQASLCGKSLAMIFEKPSLRTRLSFEVAMMQLGGHAICLDQHHIGLGQREAVEDIAHVVSRLCNGIVVRAFEQGMVEALAEHASVPVINALTDRLHPCQAMADVMTMAEHFGDAAGKTIVFVGDGNNVARSLAWVCAKLGVHFVNVCPQPYQLEADLIERLRSDAPGLQIGCTSVPREALGRADVVYTDTWVSMGQEQQREQRLRDFAPYQVNRDLLELAPRHAVVMHCMPAHRDVEITSEILDSKRSIVLDQAENRLHFQRALLEVLLARRRSGRS